MNQFLTVQDLAELTHQQVSTIYKWCSARRVPFIRLGKRTLFREDEIQEWLDSKRIEPAAGTR